MRSTGRRRVFKKTAKSILFGSLAENLLSVLIVIAVNMGFLHISVIVSELFAPFVGDYALICINMLLILSSVLLAVPVNYGFFKRMIAVSERSNAPISTMFDVFSSVTETAKSYRLFFMLLLWGGLTALSVAAVYGLYTVFSEVIDGVFGKSVIFGVFGIGAVLLCAIIVGIAVCFASLLILGRCLCTFYLCAKGEDGVFISYSKAGKILRGRRIEFLTVNLSFIPWYVLSVLTAGILFPLFTYPYHIITVAVFFRYAARQTEFLDENQFVAVSTGATDRMYGMNG